MDLSSFLPVLRTLLHPPPLSPHFTGTFILHFPLRNPLSLVWLCHNDGHVVPLQATEEHRLEVLQKLPSSLLVAVLHSRCGWHASPGQRGGGHAAGPARAHGAAQDDTGVQQTCRPYECIDVLPLHRDALQHNKKNNNNSKNYSRLLCCS